MKYCAKCGTVMNEPEYFALKAANIRGDGRVICPTRGCYNEIVDVDETFIPLLKSLYDAGIVTMHSCAGHFWELEDDSEDIYILYDYDFDVSEKGFVRAFTEALMKLSHEKRYKFLRVDIRDGADSPIYPYKDLEGEHQDAGAAIRVSAAKPLGWKNCTILEHHAALLTRQAEFIEAIDAALKDAIIATYGEKDGDSIVG